MDNKMPDGDGLYIALSAQNQYQAAPNGDILLVSMQNGDSSYAQNNLVDISPLLTGYDSIQIEYTGPGNAIMDIVDQNGNVLAQQHITDASYQHFMETQDTIVEIVGQCTILPPHQ